MMKSIRTRSSFVAIAIFTSSRLPFTSVQSTNHNDIMLGLGQDSKMSRLVIQSTDGDDDLIRQSVRRQTSGQRPVAEWGFCDEVT